MGFFHCLAVFFRTLGARGVALLALLIERGFAAQQLDERDIAARTNKIAAALWRKAGIIR